MTVATPKLPNYNAQTGTEYALALDAQMSVVSRLAAAYAPHEEASPSALKVVVDAGAMFVNGELVANAAQTVTLATADATNPRIDRVVIDALTGVASKVDGTPAGSPTAPAIPAGKLPVAQVLVTAGMTVVANSAITDERTPAVPPSSASHGQCRMTKDGSGNLLLSRHNGNKLIIDSVVQTIPDAGVSLSPASLADNNYYIYAYMSSGTMTLEASTTGHATQAGTGVEIKSGDATRTLVGMARRSTGIWLDTGSKRCVVSYFNRRPIPVRDFLTSDITHNSTTFAPVNVNTIVEWMSWADDAILYSVAGACSDDTAVATVHTSIGIDQPFPTTPLDMCSFGQSVNANSIFPVGFCASRNPTSEGYHYANIIGKVSAGIGKWYGSANPAERTGIHLQIMG